MATPSPLYFYQNPLQQVIFDKTTGEPLAGGIVTYWTDSSMTQVKYVFEWNGSTFVNLGSSLTLSGIGSFVNLSGQNLQPFLYPYSILQGQPNAPGVFESYFIYVTDANGGFQFSVQNWPPNNFAGQPTTTSAPSSLNQLTNPTFAEVLFTPVANFALPVTGTGTITQIAPSWYVKTSGTDTVTLTQNSLSTVDATNPSFSLSIKTGTGSLSAFSLFQRIDNSPRLLEGAFASGFFEAASNVAVGISMTYTPSSGSPVLLSNMTTTNDGVYNSPVSTGSANANAVLITSVNTDPGATGFVDIVFTPTTLNNTWSITSAQLEAEESLGTIPAYHEVSVPIQESLDAYYWVPQLKYKPIKSYLVGWDFPLNPAQFAGVNRTVAASSVGANKSYYAWDQTIIFQSANSSVMVNQGNPISLQMTATGQIALIQYLEGNLAKELLLNPLSVWLRGVTTVNQILTVSLWYTTDAQLPDLNTPNFNSLVATLDANGKPATFNGTWSEVPRALGKGQINIGNNGGVYGDYPLSGWNLNSLAIANTATYFAIVVGTNSVLINNVVNIESISLVPGTIPTLPSPQSQDEVQRQCQYYYRKSFLPTTSPAANTGIGTGESYGFQVVAASTDSIGPIIYFDNAMRATPVVATYNPASTGSQIYNISHAGSWTNTEVITSPATVNSAKGFTLHGITTGSAQAGDISCVHWTASALLGVVL